jgi:hypothetical protein
MTDEPAPQRIGLAEASALVGIIVLLLGTVVATYGVSGNGSGVASGIKAVVELAFGIVGAGGAYQMMRGPQTPTKQRAAAIGATILAVSAALLVMELIDQTKIFSNDLAVTGSNFSINASGSFSQPTYWSSTIAAFVAFGIGALAITRWRSWLLVTVLLISGVLGFGFAVESGAVSLSNSYSAGSNVVPALIGIVVALAFFGVGWIRAVRGSDQGEFLWLLAAVAFPGALGFAASSEIPAVVVSAGTLVAATRPAFYSRGLIAGSVVAGSVSLVEVVISSSNDWNGLITAVVGAVILALAAVFLFATNNTSPVAAMNAAFAAPAVNPASAMPIPTPASAAPAANPTSAAPLVEPAQSVPAVNPTGSAAAQAFKTPPHGARISDDKAYWWDEAEQRWQLLRISPDNYYYWDGIAWRPRS